MTVAFRCQCGQKLRANKNLVGRQTRCPKCQAQVTIPASTPTPAAAPEIDTGIAPPPKPIEAAPEISLGGNSSASSGSGSHLAPSPPPASSPSNDSPPVPSTAAPVAAPTSAPTLQPSPNEPTAHAPASNHIDLMIPCQCGNSFRVSTEFAGKPIPCPHCGTTCTVPAMVPASSSPAPRQEPIHSPVVVETPVADTGVLAPTEAPMPLRRGSGNEFAMQRIGLLVAAIAMCVCAGGFAMWFLAEGLSEISVAMVTAGVTKPPERPETNSGMSFEQRRQVREDYQKKYQAWAEKQSKRREKMEKRAKSAKNLADVSIVFLKISHIVLFLAIVASIVGYVFCFLNPKRPAIMGVAIAITATAALGAIFQMIFQTVPILDSKSSLASEYRGHYPLVFGWPREVDAGDIVLSGFVDALIYVPLILGGVLLLLIGKAIGNQTARMSGLISVCLISGYGVFLMLLLVMGMIEFEVESLTPIYIMWVVKWIANLAFAVGIFFLIRGLFSGRNSGGQLIAPSQSRSFTSNPAFR